MDTSSLRTDYIKDELLEEQALNCPFAQFLLWFEHCQQQNLPEPYAMALATTDANFQPYVRIVLMRNFSINGLTFFTNYSSAKAQQIECNSHAQVLFFWQPLERQVRISGIVSKLNAEESNNYFSQRPLNSQISAIISQQSKIINSRQELESKYNKFLSTLDINSNDTKLQCPQYWGGYIIKPTYFEFWQGRSSRLHDRIIYTQQSTQDTWLKQRLAP